MEPEAPKVPANSAAARGLPPVTPPSGRFIAQLFLVPGLIVAVAMLILLGFRYLVGGSHSPAYFLKQLDSSNVDIRWRGASDLAQVLKRTESVALRSDAKFALDLAERLRAALDELNQAEQATRDRLPDLSQEEEDLAWQKLTPQRDQAQFLAAALGDFHVPVGVPLLSEIALRADSPDVNGNTLQRRKAVWALGNLGENIKGFKKLPAEKQAEILHYLQKESQPFRDVLVPVPSIPIRTIRSLARETNQRAVWARNALFYLDKKESSPLSANLGLIKGLLACSQNPIQALPFFYLRPEIPSGVVEVDRVLARCARDEDRYLRALVALSINFWDGPLVEPTLLLLARDDGFGTLITVPEN